MANEKKEEQPEKYKLTKEDKKRGFKIGEVKYLKNGEMPGALNDEEVDKAFKKWEADRLAKQEL